MRVGIVTCYLAMGESTDSGLGRHYVVLARELAKRGHDVYVFLIPFNQDVSVVQADVGTEQFPFKIVVVNPELPYVIQGLVRRFPSIKILTQLVLGSRRLCKAVLSEHRREPIDIVETHSTNVPGLWLCGVKRTVRPRVVTRVATTYLQMKRYASKSSISYFDKVVNVLERFATLKSECMITHSTQHLKILEEEFLDGRKPHGQSIVSLGVSANQSSAACQRSGDAVNVLFVGRFERRKGIDKLLEVIPEILAVRKNVSFTLVGKLDTDHPHWKGFEERNPTYDRSRVRVTGRVSDADLEKLYRECDIFVAPSRYESFGLIYIEAMRYGKPVIGCDVGGIPDVVTHMHDGTLVPPGNAEELKKALLSLVDSKSLREQMGRSAAQTYLSKFSADAMTEQTLNLYSSFQDRS